MKQGIIEAHGSSAREYDEAGRQAEWRGHEILFGMAYEYVRPGEALLDIGIGTGLSAGIFGKAGMRVYGVDGSEEMLEVCREKGIAVELKTHDLCRRPWPYGDGQFDHAICSGVFHFYRDLGIFFGETARVLRAGGTFGFIVMEAAGDVEGYRDEGSGLAIYRHGEGYLGPLLREYGFERLKATAFYGYKTPEKRERLLCTAYIAKK